MNWVSDIKNNPLDLSELCIVLCNVQAHCRTAPKMEMLNDLSATLTGNRIHASHKVLQAPSSSGNFGWTGPGAR